MVGRMYRWLVEEELVRHRQALARARHPGAERRARRTLRKPRLRSNHRRGSRRFSVTAQNTTSADPSKPGGAIENHYRSMSDGSPQPQSPVWTRSPKGFATRSSEIFRSFPLRPLVLRGCPARGGPPPPAGGTRSRSSGSARPSCRLCPSAASRRPRAPGVRFSWSRSRCLPPQHAQDVVRVPVREGDASATRCR